MAIKKIEKKAPVLLGVILAGGIAFLNFDAKAEQDLKEKNIKTNVSVEELIKETNEKTVQKIKEEDESVITPEEIIKKRENLNNFLFIGDSFTYLMKDTISYNNDNVYIHAKSGSRPSYWIDRVDNMPEANSVDGVVLLIGVNGASTTENKEDVVTLMNKISKKYPDKKVYVQKIFPVGENFHAKGFNDKINSLNEVIENHINVLDNFTFIDTTTGFVDENGNLKHTYDELHISSDYHDMQ